MEKSAKYRLLFNRRGVELGPKDKAQVMIEVYLNRLRKFIPTGLYLYRDQWKDGAVVKHEKAMDINLDLNKKVLKLMDFEYAIRNKGEVFTLSSLDSYDENDDHKDFIQYIKKTVGGRKDISKDTRIHHEALAKRLEDYNKIRYFQDLTYEKISAFDNFLIQQGKLRATIHNHHKFMKIYINMAIKSGYMKMDQNPYLKFVSKRGTSLDRKYLTQEELAKIENEPFESGRMAIMRDLFLFSCYTGLAYSDAAKLKPDCVLMEKGEKWLQISREKTDKTAKIMLLPQALEIIERYRGIKKDRLLPYYSNQKMNEYLKFVGSKCGIKKDLTTHMARHTFATTVTLMNGVSLEALKKMLGHSSIRITEIYGKIVDERIQNEMTKLRDKHEMTKLKNKAK